MIPIPKELLEQIERGNVLLFIGERIVRDAAGRAVLDQLTAQLAARCGNTGAKEQTFPEAAQAYQDEKGRQAMVQFIRDQLEASGDEPQQAHRLIAGLTDCKVLATTCLDRQLERAFEERGRPLDVIIGNVDVAFEDERKAQLYKLRGSVERAESLVLTEDDYETFFEDQASISVVLQGYLARKTILFIGYDLADPYFKRLYRKVTTSLDKFARRAYAFGETPPPKVCRWCERHGIEVVETDTTAFLEAMTGQLTARARPAPIVPSRPVVEPAAPLPERPYKLLDYYETKDEAIFFGRQQETQTLTSLIHAHRLVLLYGASGVGKTSLLLAGVAPRLESSEPPYEAIYVRALEDPALVIRCTIRRRLSEADLPEDGSLVDFLNAATEALGRTLVIVLDQFEEFFIRLSPQFRAAFIAELGALYDARDVPIKVVLSLREDWLASVSEIEERIPEVFRTRMRLLPLTRDQARQAITAPVERPGVNYESALVERLLDDLMGSEGTAVMPPQLQLVCSALYGGLGPDECQITLTAYERLGGVQGVLQKYLEDELARLGSDERVLARGVLEELVTSQGTKAVKTSGELVLALDVDISDVESVLEKLVRARLLRVLEREDSGMAYELAHEYLIRKISLSPEAQLRKQTEELIQQDEENWRRFGLLIDHDRFSLLNRQREKIHLAPERASFMLRCAIRHNIEVEYWVDTLNVQDAAEIVENILNEKENWVRRSDRINALHAALHLPSEIYEPLLYEQALAKDHVLAQEARALLRGLGCESTVAHFYTLWESGSEEEHKGAIRVLSELDSPAATEALDKILRSQPTESRMDCIEIVGQADPNDAQCLLAQIAICDSSSAVREKAQQYLNKAPGTGTAREVFELCVPHYQNYTQYFRDAWSDGNDGALTIRSIKRIVAFVGSISQAIKRPDMLIHNRALLVACKFLGKDSVDPLA